MILFLKKGYFNHDNRPAPDLEIPGVEDISYEPGTKFHINFKTQELANAAANIFRVIPGKMPDKQLRIETTLGRPRVWADHPTLGTRIAIYKEFCFGMRKATAPEPEDQAINPNMFAEAMAGAPPEAPRPPGPGPTEAQLLEAFQAQMDYYQGPQAPAPH